MDVMIRWMVNLVDVGIKKTWEIRRTLELGCVNIRVDVRIRMTG